MKKLIMLVSLIILSGCGQGSQGPQGVPGPQGSPAPAPETLEGYYTLSDGSYIDIYEDAQGTYTVRATRLTYLNADGSTGTLPAASFVATASEDGRLYLNSSMTFVALTHNVKQDSNNTVLVGSFFTELTVYKSNGLLKVKTIINSTSGVLFKHTISEE